LVISNGDSQADVSSEEKPHSQVKLDRLMVEMKVVTIKSDKITTIAVDCPFAKEEKNGKN